MNHNSKWKDSLIGKTFGYLTIIERNGNVKLKDGTKGEIKIKCKCICGKIIRPVLGNVIRKGQKSCGCKNPLVNFKHGYSNTKLYSSWNAMIHRCNNPNDVAYHLYGDRGIKVCPEWKDFLTFRFQMRKKFFNAKKKYPKEMLSIERLNGNDDYNYKNCIFIPLKINCIHRCNVVKVKAINRITKKEYTANTQKELAKKIGIHRSTIQKVITGVYGPNKNWIFQWAIKKKGKSNG